MDSHTATNISWPPAKKFLFCFCFTYFFLYCFPFPLDSFEFTKPVAQPFYNFLDWLIPQIAAKLFHFKAKTAFPMFDKMDDSNYGLAFLYFNVIFSLVVAFIWSVADRKRKNYEKLYQWLRLYLRYYLAAFLFGYGFIKVFPSQFQPITASRLTMSVGEQSPMLLAWNFMGYSVVMMRINGIAEVLAGLLLLFRRTTTVGAILSACVFSFVVMMDFCFNVPVRLLASHLLLISLFLVLEDRQRLLNIFLLNKPTSSTVYTSLITSPVSRKIFGVLQATLAIGLLYSTIVNAAEAEKQDGQSSPHVPLYGVYNTAYFLRNNDTVPSIETDSLRWKQLVIDGNSWKQSGIIEFNTGRKFFCNIQADTIKKIMSIQSQSDSTEKYLFHYSLQNNRNILLKGFYKKDSIEVLMNKFDLNNYLLYKEKFKWISE
jgi:uncharacterized membrane protein YphA (DoxX/SURF4 family)